MGDDAWTCAPWPEVVASLLVEMAALRPLMTLRVSYDGGRTWGRTVETTRHDHLPPMASQMWPACACVECVPGNRWRQAG